MQRHMQRRGFTLIEMLVTVTVIGIIVAMALGALVNAQESAREQRTRSLISKLHTQMMYRWESYQTRRLPMAIPGGKAQDRAWYRLQASREMMRLELPERWSDITDPTNPGNPVRVWFLNELPALSESYLRFYNSLPSPATAANRFENAECLYLIVTMGHDDSLGTTKFRASDVGDVDGDGAKEFIDGWGRPIIFLRWAPGYLPQSTDPASNKAFYAGHNLDEFPPASPPSGFDIKSMLALGDLQNGDTKADHDPYDPLLVDAIPAQVTPFALSAAQRQTLANDRWRGYRLMPLIVSAGPDGKYDIKTDDGVQGSGNDLNYSINQPLPNDPYQKFPYTDSPERPMIGTPFDDDNDGTIDHVDNLTNHALEVR